MLLALRSSTMMVSSRPIVFPAQTKRSSISAITEAHPKAVLRALGYTWSEFCSAFAVKGIAENDEHRQDALVSAVAAREGFEGRWPIDLGKKRYECEQDPSANWLAPMDYFWPNTAA
jgi:hypothetical protein